MATQKTPAAASSKSEPESSLIGLAFGIVGLGLGSWAGLVKGTWNALNGKSFDEGFFRTADRCAAVAERIGNENAPVIKETAIKAATGVAVVAGSNEIRKHW